MEIKPKLAEAESSTHKAYKSGTKCSSYCIFINNSLCFFYNSNSIAEGDSDDGGDDDEEGDLILENDCLTPYDSHRVTNSNTMPSRDSLSNGPHKYTVGRPLPQSVSLPSNVGASLRNSSTVISTHNGNSTHTASSSEDSMREDSNITTL